MRITFSPAIPAAGSTSAGRSRARIPYRRHPARETPSPRCSWDGARTDTCGGITPSASSGYFGTFVQDDWRITPKLTLNIGLRYEFNIPRAERFDRLDWFDYGAASPL